ncbi:MAG: sulfotransferase [Bacteroidales bacterium]|nr:sulfotransferase [Bacteroidales bacterium]
MNTGRHSTVAKLGRGLQKALPAVSFLDAILGIPVLLRPKSEFPVVFLLAPPRSGSTLTYQLLTTAFQNQHLTNAGNLLYTMPAFGGWVSEKLCSSRSSEFKSKQGFVAGLCGEAEGLRFWSHWTGITLDDSTTDFKANKAGKLKNKLEHLCSEDTAFITGYLGHVLAIDKLKKLFPNAVFLYLQRDLFSNAISLYNVSSDDWYSVKTKSFPEVQSKDRFAQIARQLTDIHRLIIKQKDERFYTLRYETLCEKPEELIADFQKFAGKQGVHLQRKPSAIPNTFPYQVKTPSDSKIYQHQYEALEKEISFLDDEVRKEMKKML